MNTRSLFLIFLAIVLMCGSASAAIPTDYLYYFNCNDASGNTLTNSNVSNPDATLYGSESQLWDNDGAVHFNGTSLSYGLIANDASNVLSGTDSFTLIANFSANSASRSISIARSGNLYFGIWDNYPHFSVFDAANSTEIKFIGSSPISLTESHVLVAQGNGTHVTLICDNEVVATGLYPSGGIKTNTNSLRVGAYSTTYTEQILYDLYWYDYVVENTSQYYSGSSTPVGMSGRARLRTPYAAYNDSPVLYIEGVMDFAYLYNNTFEYDSVTTPVDMSEYIVVEGDNITLSGIYMIINQNADDYSLDLHGYNNIFLDWQPNETQIATGADTFEFNGGYYNWSSLHISGLNNTRWELTGVTGQGTNDNIINSVFENTFALRTYGVPKHFVMENITFHDSRTAFSFLGSPIVTSGYVRNIYMDYMEGTFFSMTNFTNFVVDNFTVDRYYEPDDSMTGFNIQGVSGETRFGIDMGGHNLSCYNITLNGTGRSGFSVTELAYDVYAKNIEVNLSGHNGVDLHPSFNVTMDNVIIRESSAENFMITSGDQDISGLHDKSNATDERSIYTVPHNFYITNVSSYDPAGSAFSINGFVGAYFENIYCQNQTNGWTANTYEDLTVINSTAVNTSAFTMTLGYQSATYGWANDTKFIDCEHGIDGKPSYLVWSFNTSFINVNETAYNLYSVKPNEMSNYQYINARVVNITGYPVANAILTANTTTRNGYGNIQTTFYTDDSGYINMENRSNRMAVIDYYRNNSGIIQYSSLITASKDGENDTAVFTPDGTYSANTSTGGLSGELITFTLDVPGEGGEPAVDYFYGNTDYSYLDYPEVLEWNSTLGIFTKRFLLDGTILEEDAPERVTGVEVMP